MQISCYELYEEEKAKNSGKKAAELFYTKYKLHPKGGGRFHYFDYTDFAIDDSYDIMLSLYYTTSGELRDGAYGCISYNFYILKNGSNYFLRYYDIKSLENIAIKIGKKTINNIWYISEIAMGRRTKEYRKCALNDVDSNEITLDSNEVESLFKELGKIASDEIHYENIDYLYPDTSLEILDYVNHREFYADDYALQKYQGYIDAVQYIIEKSGMKWMKKCDIQYVGSLEEAWEKFVDRHLRSQYMIYD